MSLDDFLCMSRPWVGLPKYRCLLLFQMSYLWPSYGAGKYDETYSKHCPGAPAGVWWCSRWTPSIDSLCKGTHKGKKQTQRLFIALAMKQQGRLLPAPIQPNGYKATAKMQVWFFPLGLHSLQVSTEISFSIKGVPDCPWVLQKPGLPHL